MPRKKETPPSEIIDALRANLQLLGELAVRYEVNSTSNPKKKQRLFFTRPAEVHALLRDEMFDLVQEQFHVLLLDARNNLVGRRVIYQGTVTESLVRPAEVLRPAVEQGVPGIIVVHNHPSHEPSPSPDDIRTTRELQQAAKLLGIELLDHVVIGGDNYASLSDLGHITH